MAEEKSYSAGDLNLSIETLSANSLKSLDAVIDRLNIIETKFKTINKFSKELGKNNKLDKNFKYIYGKDGNISKILPSVKPTSKSRSSKSSADSMFNLAKMGAIIHSARRLGGLVYKITQYGADFAETLNLWKVSMGNDLIPQATKFVDKLNEAYGISKKTLMNAQATFKNMLGSLGNISEAQSYALSEGITQMALDYASLYNQTFEQAFTKFQAALAGQVRPIRSVSGFDITEQTLFDLYQSLGGDKSMRQLNRTEKQLLAILAIFEQMNRTGTQGDLARTIESFANQTRIAKDQLHDILSYSGAIVTQWLTTSGIMAKFVGTLIFLADVLEEIAKAKGALDQDSYSDAFGKMEESANGANRSIDELQGKLLEFDKFRALDDSQSSGLDLDETVLKAMSDYQSAYDNLDTESKKFAETLKTLSGLWGEDGVFNPDALGDISDKIIDIAQALGILVFSLALGKGILKNLGLGLLVTTLADLYINNEDFRESVNELVSLLGQTLKPIVTFLVDSFGDLLELLLPIITKFFEWEYATAALATIFGSLIAWNIGVWLTKLDGGLSKIISHFPKIHDAFSKFNEEIINCSYSIDTMSNIIFFAIGAIAGFSIMDTIISNLEGNAQDLVSSWSIVAGVLATVLGIILAIHGGTTGGLIGASIAGLGVGALVAGIKAQALGNAQFQLFESGGLPDKGTAFIAGEAGAEMVYNMPSGQSGVANIQQIAQATYNGTIKALNDWWGGSQARGDIPQLREANATGMYQAVTGVAKSYGEKWSK